jgi:hypothetical protein
VVDGGFDTSWRVMRDIGWRGRRLVQSAAKPNMRRKTHQSVLEQGDGNNRISLNYTIITLIRIFAINVRLTSCRLVQSAAKPNM